MLAVFLGILAAFSWSVHDLIARAIAARVGPFRLAALVTVAGGLALSLHFASGAALPTWNRDGLLLSLGLGVAYGLGAAGLYKAFSLGPVSLVAPLTAAYPVLVLAWGLLHGLSPTALQWLAAAVAIAGAMLVGWAGGGSSSMLPRRSLVAIFAYSALAIAGYAAAVVIGQHAAVAIGEIAAAWISRPAGLAVLIPFCLSEARPAPFGRRHWAAIVAMGLFDVAGLVAVNASGHLPDREFAAIGISSYGAIAVLLAMLVLREQVRPLQWLGIAMIVAGVAALSVSP